MKNNAELREMTSEALNAELLVLRKEQFNLRMQQANQSLTKTHHVRAVRRAIARVKTILTEKAGVSHVSK